MNRREPTKTIFKTIRSKYDTILKTSKKIRFHDDERYNVVGFPW